MGTPLTRAKHVASNFGQRLSFVWRRHMQRTVILQPGYPGLGDHLLISHIPRIAKGAGLRVLFSKRASVRDPDYMQLIWESNPHLDGFTDEPGYCLVGPHATKAPLSIAHVLLRLGLDNRVGVLDEGCNLLDQFMRAYGLDDGMRQHEPEIYHHIARQPKYEGLVVYDPNYITSAGNLTAETVREFFMRNNIQVDAQMTPRGNSFILPAVSRSISTEDVYDFCSLIVSCKHMFCLTTGTATLAAALRKPCTVLYGEGHNRLYRHSPMHDYVKLESR
jgi:hypothetical protein